MIKVIVLNKSFQQRKNAHDFLSSPSHDLYFTIWCDSIYSPSGCSISLQSGDRSLRYLSLFRVFWWLDMGRTMRLEPATWTPDIMGAVHARSAPSLLKVLRTFISSFLCCLRLRRESACSSLTSSKDPDLPTFEADLISTRFIPLVTDSNEADSLLYLPLVLEVGLGLDAGKRLVREDS